MKTKLLALLLTLTLCLALVPTAAAVPSDTIDAKDDLATVDITQTYNGVVTDTQVHNYDTDGTEVGITYSATLKMTEEMAIYLQARQEQLLNAKFNVHVMIDAKDDKDTLEFAEKGDTLTVTFSSSFLKPWDVDAQDKINYPNAFDQYSEGDYTYKFLGRDANGLFSYEISVRKAWAQSHLDNTGCIDVPMELIVCYDGTDTYGYEDLFDKDGHVLEEFESMQPMYMNFDVEDWMKEIKVTLAQLRVKDSVPATVTYNSATWRKVTASGTVDGEFTYEKAQTIGSFKDYNYANTGKTTNTLEFGNDFNNDPDDDDAIEEWTSNEVWVYLIRFANAYPEQDPDSPFLNLEDHFAYIIGMPDGLVHPEWTITRAEVATIFFRMLTDEVRNEFWCQTNPYYDVDINDWYNNAISTLTNLGVVNGMPDGGFHPTAEITRGEFATMAVRFFLITEDMYGEIKEDAFSDIAGHWANDYINMAYLLEIVNGYPDGTFQPNRVIDRSEAMTIVNNTLRRSPCNEGIEPVEEHEDFITWPDNMNKNKWYYAAVQEATNSHDYTYFTDRTDLMNKELWQDILPVRDWAAFERAWSDANSAYNPGEVVNGK